MGTAHGQKEEGSWVRGEYAENMFVAFKKLKAIKLREIGSGKWFLGVSGEEGEEGRVRTGM